MGGMLSVRRSMHLVATVNSLKRRPCNFGIRRGLLRNLLIRLRGKSVVFPDPKRSDLLLGIALFGDESYEGELAQLLKGLPVAGWSVFRRRMKSLIYPPRLTWGNSVNYVEKR